MTKILKGGEFFCDVQECSEIGEIKRDEVVVFGQSKPLPVAIYRSYVVGLTKHLENNGLNYTIEFPDRTGRIIFFDDVSPEPELITYEIITNLERKEG